MAESRCTARPLESFPFPSARNWLSIQAKCCAKISVALVATGPPALWSSEQNVPTWQPSCAKQSLFSKTPWTQAQSRSLGDPASFHRCRCADSFARDVGKRGGLEPVLVRQFHCRAKQPRSFINMCPSHVDKSVN